MRGTRLSIIPSWVEFRGVRYFWTLHCSAPLKSYVIPYPRYRILHLLHLHMHWFVLLHWHLVISSKSEAPDPSPCRHPRTKTENKSRHLSPTKLWTICICIGIRISSYPVLSQVPDLFRLSSLQGLGPRDEPQRSKNKGTNAIACRPGLGWVGFRDLFCSLLAGSSASLDWSLCTSVPYLGERKRKSHPKRMSVSLSDQPTGHTLNSEWLPTRVGAKKR